MKVWIDQDCCTGAGLCVDHCPDLCIVLDDGIGYVHDGALIITDPDHPSVPVSRRGPDLCIGPEPATNQVGGYEPLGL